MKMSAGMSYVMMLAQGEAAMLSHEEVFPEHVLLGLLEIAGLTAGEISSLARDKRLVLDRDIISLRAWLDGLTGDITDARAKLRFILQLNPSADEAEAAIGDLLVRSARHAREIRELFPSDVLAAMVEEPTPAIREVLNLKERDDNSHSGE